MVLRQSRLLLFVAPAMIWMLGAQQAEARHRTSPDLFYNYYVPASYYGGVPTQLYLCPRPTPPRVGHTYVTYQPLMPHEFLYKHRRVYRRYNPGSGWTRTSVSWR